MKKLFVLCTILCSMTLLAQEKPVQILFDITSSKEEPQKATIRHVKAMSEAYPESQFEIVVYGGSLDMLLDEKSDVKEDVILLSQRSNVTVNACAGTMKRKNVDKSQLIKGVQVVPDAIYEIAIRQQEGWSYVKESYNN